ncbi:hypothetical protein WJX72_000630 [[Myrmecia] bisecta]|uniref:Diacylglycerol kinase n=1 Tax=[Myrmecia] bisecta TaxID=41462 RepID=A0AAW1PR56_9CHLO
MAADTKQDSSDAPLQAPSLTYRIPLRYLAGTREDLPHTDAATEDGPLLHPVLVFINPKSGSHIGHSLQHGFERVLGKAQVFVVPHHKPAEVLHRLYQDLTAARKQGDEQADHVLQNLRVVAAGGDGTISWVLQAIKIAEFEPPPATSVVPLGTGNGMSINLGWGKKADRRLISSDESLIKMVEGVVNAHVRNLDIWDISISVGVPDEDIEHLTQHLAHDVPKHMAQEADRKRAIRLSSMASRNDHAAEIDLGDNEAKPVGMLKGQAPGPWSEQVRKSMRPHGTQKAPILDDKMPSAMQPIELQGRMAAACGGKFTYYLTVGLDAEAAYRFDQMRKQKPHLSKHRLQNIFWYGYEGCATGWLCGGQRLKPLLPSLKVRKRNGEWQQVELPDSLRALLVLNLQSYSGSRDVWGLHDDELRPEEAAKGFSKPIFDDGLIEVVGLTSGLKTLAVLSNLSPRVHGKRIAQAEEVLLTLQSSDDDGATTHMRIDGEPWQQHLPAANSEHGPLKVHIKSAGTARVLINTQELPGVTAKALKLAKREADLS